MLTFWNSLKLKTKLISLTVFMAVIISVVALNSYSGLENVNQARKNITDYSIPNLIAFSRMDLAYRSLRIELRTLGLPNLSAKQNQDVLDGIQKYIKAFEDAKVDYRKQEFLPGEKELFTPLEKEWEDFKILGGEILKYNSSSDPADKEKMIQIFKIDCPKSAAKVDGHMARLNDFHREMANKFIKDSETQTQESNLMNLIIGTGGIIAGLLIGIYVATQTSKTISTLAALLFENSEDVANASTHIADSSQELSAASTEQAASLEETAASLEEITAMIAKASESAKQTSASSEQSQNKATEGREAVEEMVKSMDEINQSNMAIMNQINTSNQQLAEIVKVIQEIGSKTQVINDIVFQTKLLSFNASVEAARAGEHGKGFAVVAEEVGSLAVMSGNAAKEITDMLGESINKVESIVRETKTKVEGLVDNGKAKVQKGMQVASNCSELLGEIVSNVSHVSELAREISQANKEQVQGVEEINKAMAQLDSVTQQNTSASNEASLEAEKLACRADNLQSLIEQLVTTVEGSNHADPKARKPAPVAARKSASLKVVPTPKVASRPQAKVISLKKNNISHNDLMPTADDPRFEIV